MADDFVFNPDCPFSEKSFKLLATLPKKETQNFYLAHEEEFKNYVMKPLQELFHQLTAQLPDHITKQLELGNGISPSPKYQSYVGNFYRKEAGLKGHNSELFITLEKGDFRFGLFISASSLDKQLFIGNYKKLVVKEFVLQHTHLPANCLLHTSKQGCWSIHRYW